MLDLNLYSDLCSRVTFVNFTVTPGSLQSQCLHEVLKTERPDIHHKRLDLMKLQGEFKVKLRNLEKSLLDALNESQGNILDNDNAIATLERLKNEAADVGAKMQETEVVMEEISRVSEQYTPLAVACSSIYFALEQAASVHFLYQFSLRFFLSVFQAVLYDNPRLQPLKEPAARLEQLAKDIFQLTYHRVSRSLLHDDHLAFALRLCQIRLRQLASTDQVDTREFDFFLRSGESISARSQSHPLLALLNPGQLNYVLELQSLPALSGLVTHISERTEEWKSFLAHPTAETAVPLSWQSDTAGKLR
jgi:dynein heavy chain 1